MDIQIISLLVALLAVVFGPILSYKIAKKQLYSQYIIYDRQLWLRDVRDLTAEYLTLWKEFTDKVHWASEKLPGEYYEKAQHQLMLLSHKLFLYLDKEEKYQLDYYNALHESIIIIPSIHKEKNFEKNFWNGLRKLRFSISEII